LIDGVHFGQISRDVNEGDFEAFLLGFVVGAARTVGGDHGRVVECIDR